MNLISCRANFTAPAAFGPHATQGPDDGLIGHGLAPGYARDLQGWLLIHGYHNTAGAAESSYSDIEQRLPGAALTGYLWPGGDIAVDFLLAVIRAREAGWRLADLLNGQKAPQGLGVQTHSLGALVILTALATGAVELGDIILSAPAVDENCLQPDGQFAQAIRYCKSLNVFYSANDPVLKGYYPLGSFGRQALGLNGPIDPSKMPANVRLFNCSRIVTGHGWYRYAPEYYAAWRSVADETAKFGLTVL
jgi:hypothetical protein